ncbi:MAG: cytochrome c biogenesis protein CcsA [Candidatus Omnitrophica bacterium]|nr:cytochrome c biogenesis protein CcsA [Candidatus Omnitrophota bacterium]
MIPLHVAALFASYAAFFAAVVTGVAFLVQERRIKRKDPSVLRAGTVPLELLDRANLVFVVAGFLLFSFGMLQGNWLARKEWGAYFTGDLRERFSLVIWAFYGWVLWLRLTVGLRGRRVIFLSVMSFLLVVFTFHLISHGYRGTGS